MVKRMTDLMNAEYSETIELGAADAAMAERIIGKMNMEHKRRRLPLTILVAAVVALLTIGTVAAVAFSRQNTRDVSTEEVGHYVPDKFGNITYVKWEDASLAFEFEIEAEEFREVYFRTGWLPTPCDENDAQYVKDDGWTFYQRSTPAAQGVPFEIQVLWGHRLVDTTWFIGGEAEVVKEDTWNGLMRTEVVAHEPNDPLDNAEIADTNYIILFSEADNYLIKICGYSDFETLERIADEMEILVTENVVQEENTAEDGLFTAQPLTMEGVRITEMMLEEVNAARERGEERWWNPYYMELP